MTADSASPASFDRGKIVLASPFLTLTVFYAIWYSCSVFLVALLREFSWIFDRTGSHALALWLALAMALVSPVLLWAAAPRRANASGAG
jgi:hypothetical protein